MLRMRGWLQPGHVAAAMVTLSLLAGVVLVFSTSLQVAHLGPVMVGSVALGVVLASLLGRSARKTR
jgi:hypothetical protein